MGETTLTNTVYYYTNCLRERKDAESKDNNKKSRRNLHNRNVLCADSIICIQLCDS